MRGMSLYTGPLFLQHQHGRSCNVSEPARPDLALLARMPKQPILPIMPSPEESVKEESSDDFEAIQSGALFTPCCIVVSTTTSEGMTLGKVNNNNNDELRYERQEEHWEEVSEEHEGVGDMGGDVNNPENEVHPQTMGWIDEDLEELHHMARLNDAQDAMAFITALRKASFDDPHSCLPDNAIHRLRHPPRELPDATNPDLIQSLKYYFADTTIKAYNAIHGATMEQHPEDDIYTHYRIQQAIAELSGVVPIVHDMCINTCLAFTGPFTHLDQCPRCREDHWDMKKSTDRKKAACQ
ncbi:uncharacterized protein F5891DRAFT_1187391 [Suillus fuscotomentosus]|uniref:Uncharacterized protein n=1 Tax=Suillus fuscotomentosus TaxID=1912939 RepID=A0AAD4E8Z8_9AGAM|nr:uncharacterized protein F5891DRAFT_1187391 [Suillus fuscotomentosus]KAG1901531.1 hypothetical protein F5891DRAFT_1187391 [Suillus fuscotomentosus]